MATKKSLVTPKGTLSFPWLNRPDTKFGTEKFKTGLVFENQAAAQSVIDAAKAIAAEEFGPKAKVHLPVSKQEDGSVLLRTHSTSKPSIANAKGEVIEKTLKVGGGSVAKLSITLSSYDKGGKKGVTAYLNAVQLLKLVEFGGAAAAFTNAEDEVEDAFVDAPGAFSDESAGEPANDNDEDEASSASDF
jgi:hypothetical protein